ncbi:MAG: EamA family transporter [Clostridia bacterium]|nr:EamA family transporter [Clostridia bacterium]
MSNQLKGHSLALFTVIVWGTTLFASDYLLNTANLSTSAVVMARFVIAYVILNIMYPPRLKLQAVKTEITFALAGLTGVTLYFIGENTALLSTRPANVSIIIATAPMFTSLFYRLTDKTMKLNKLFYLGFVVAMGGIVITTLSEGELGLSPKGDIIALVAAIAWAIYSVMIGRLNSLGINQIQMMRRVFFWGVVYLIPYMIISGFSISEYAAFSDIHAVLDVLYLGIVASALCYVTWNYAMKCLTPVIGSSYIYAQPVVAIIVAALKNMTLTWHIFVGAALTIMGLVISVQKPKTNE